MTILAMISALVGISLLAYTPLCMAVTTCSGYISLDPTLLRSPSSQTSDLSEIRLILSRKSGLRKETVQCAPNGFFIIPIYESGTFILETRHPQQWTLSPPSYEFTVNDDGSGTDDLNFVVQGFPVHGSVVVPQIDTCADRRAPVLDVVLSARSTTNASRAPISARPDSEGRFLLPGLTPGEYEITAQHNRRRLHPVSMMHTVSWGESHLQPFRMTGATVSGVIPALPANIAMGVYLIPRGRTISGTCSEQNPSCYSHVSNKGTFMFADVPCGIYTLSVQMADSASARYIFNINSVEVQVGFDDISVAPDTFAIVGVTIVAEVRDQTTAAPIDAAVVYVDDVEIGVTDRQGQVVWNAHDLNRHGPYVFKAVKRGVHFAETRPYYLGDAGPVIEANKYDVCGLIQIAESATVADYVVEVVVGSSVITTLALNHDGTFCYAAKPGRYVFRPVSAHGSLSPATRPVTVVHAPVDNVGFYQLTVSVHGFVSCLHRSDCEGVHVTLDKVGHSISASNVTSADGAVMFSEVAPGQYRMSARKGNLCFDPVQIEVGQHDAANVVVQQKGVEVIVRSPVLAQMDLVDTAHNSAIPVSIPAGISYSMCVPSSLPDQFQLRSAPTSSVRFVGEPVAVSEIVELALDLIEVYGDIQVPINLASALDLQAVSEHDTVTMTATIVDQHDQLATLRYRFWGRVSETYTISVLTSADLVFDPAHTQVKILDTASSVPLSAGQIRGRAGLFRSGKITPGVPGAKAIARSTDSDAALSMIITNDEYRFGPLSDAADYSINIEHPDYKFEPVGNGDFRAIKLRSIQINVVDQESGQPIEDVLLSLSGPGYRNNSLSGPDGIVSFTGLAPSQYFLFLVLKEFVFTPPSQTIDLAEEGDILVRYTISAKRTRYSVFGSVKSIAKNGVGGVVISASSADGDRIEETVSDSSGQYRIRGLLPGVPYNVTLRALESDAIERSVPEARLISMPNDDVRNVDFVCYRRPEHGYLFGTLPSGKMPVIVELRHLESGQLERAISCSPAKRFFSFYNIPFGSYLLTAQSQDVVMEPISVDVMGPVKVAFKSKTIPKEIFDETPKTSIFTIVIGFAVVFAVINYENLQVSAKKWNARRISRKVSVEQSWDITADRKNKTSPTKKSRR